MALLTLGQLKSIILESLIQEVTFDQALNVLSSKRSLNVAKNFIYNGYVTNQGEDFARANINGPDAAKAINAAHEWFTHQLKWSVPKDLTDAQRGQSLLWLISLFRDPSSDVHNHIVNSDKQNEWLFKEVPNLLESFWHWQQFMRPNDIRSISSVKDLYNVVNDAGGRIKEYQDKRDYEDVDKGTEVLVENDSWSVFAVHNKGAACYYGKGTRWCTAAPGLEFFKEYYQEGSPLVYILDKVNNKRYQFSFVGREYMDVDNEMVTYEEFERIAKVLSGISAYGIAEETRLAGAFVKFIDDGDMTPQDCTALELFIEKAVQDGELARISEDLVGAATYGNNLTFDVAVILLYAFRSDDRRSKSIASAIGDNRQMDYSKIKELMEEVAMADSAVYELADALDRKLDQEY